jgi:hypothetical protein
MDKHYHLLIETNSPTLSKGMKYLNGTYTQYFNRQHQRVGRMFQGRFKAILVQKDAYLLELARYIALNPVRAQMVQSAKAWRWSSYRATAGYEENEEIDACLTTEGILAGFDNTKSVAQQRYRDFVKVGKEQPSPWQSLKNQIYWSDDDFANDMQRKLKSEQSLKDIPRRQKQAPVKPLSFFVDHYKNRDKGRVQAYLNGHYTLAQVGEHFGVSYATVSRTVKQAEKRKTRMSNVRSDPEERYF